MPRPFINNLQDLLKFNRAKEVQVEEHSTLELITTATNTTQKIFRIATAKLTINGVAYKGALREVGSIKQSITRAANRTEAVIANLSSLVDSDIAPYIAVPPRGQPPERLRVLLGADFVNAPSEIQGAKVTIGRYWRNMETNQEFHEIVFRGVVQSTQADQNAVRLQILSDIYAASIGGGRRVARKCQWKFRDPDTCGYTGVETLCNKLLNSAGGCSGRSNEHKFGGFVYIQPKSSASGPASTSIPPSNQSLKYSDGASTTSFKQQPFVRAEGGIRLSNDDTNLATVLTGQAELFAKNFNASNNSGTGETDLHSHTLPANFYVADGDTLHFRFGGSVAANGNQKRIRLYVAGTLIYDSSATSGLNNVKWIFDVFVSKIDSDSVRVVGFFFAGDCFVGPAANTTGGTGFLTVFDTDVNSLTFSGSLIVKVTGQSAVGSNDVTQNFSILKRFKV